jgi:anti-sigma factor RsiW
MGTELHVSDKLSAWLDGRLSAEQTGAVDRHVAGCRACAEERDLLREARSLFGPTLQVEPRPGFAGRVALAASPKTRPSSALRWIFGGFATAAAAAALLIAVVPRHAPDASHSEELMLAQRLDLYEDLSVMQHRDALENLDVVENLDQLPAEGARP